ncbi:hypothetical protein MBLL_04687 (plasmid) [Methylobacterium bullatum]|uniref:Uncharacterized protein n=1 Tax=Methylobacterium bullatum TaxID=570505 RepID=A0A679K9V3_9HYPH|nr:hypothetical protein MBLL_04687 [Methylobacterium bullatum]
MGETPAAQAQPESGEFPDMQGLIGGQAQRFAAQRFWSLLAKRG